MEDDSALTRYQLLSCLELGKALAAELDATRLLDTILRKVSALLPAEHWSLLRVVDTYGHLNGTQILQEVAVTIRQCVRAPAFGVSYGGDEFVVVLPGLDKRLALDKAEEMRRTLSQTQFLANQGLQVHIAASFGVATYPEDATDRTGLLALADQAMFDVKRRGKNAVGVSGPATHR